MRKSRISNDMELVPLKLGNGNVITYQVVNGTHYHSSMQLTDGTINTDATRKEVIDILEECRKKRTLVRVFYGDTLTGWDWMEENDMVGRIGRSTGRIAIPLLVKKGDEGGPALMDNCIVRLLTASLDTLWQHPTYQMPELQISVLDRHSGDHMKEAWMKGYRFSVWRRTQAAKFELVANFKSIEQAQDYQAFMRGASLTPSRRRA